MMFTNCSVFLLGMTVESQETIYKKFYHSTLYQCRRARFGMWV